MSRFSLLLLVAALVAACDSDTSVSPTTQDVPVVGRPDVACEEGLIASCPVTFTVEATYPDPQQFVWLTGSLTGWATDAEAGALPMTLSADDTFTLRTIDD